jgi:hypothetical protein
MRKPAYGILENRKSAYATTESARARRANLFRADFTIILSGEKKSNRTPGGRAYDLNLPVNLDPNCTKRTKSSDPGSDLTAEPFIWSKTYDKS